MSSVAKTSRKTLGRALLAGVAASFAATFAQAAPWTRSFVVEWLEPALYYGGPATGGGETVGTDCPNGVNPELDVRYHLKRAGYANVEELINPDNLERPWLKAMAFRGPNKENIFEHPDAWPDPGLIEVTGKVAEGFDLDNDPKTGFVGLDGTPGVDNAWYKIAGCTTRWRGRPRDSYFHKYANDGMRDGDYTTIIVLSGNESPENDSDAKIGIYVSQDKLVKDAGGAIARDYSFNIDPDTRYQTVAKVKIVNNVVETVGPTDMRFHDYMGPQRKNIGQVNLYKSKMKFEIRPDGTLHGLIGGYRPWQEHYGTLNDFIKELVGHMSAPAMWYALQRRADGIPDPKTGKNTAISTVYRIDALPAFVMTPDGGKSVQVAADFQPAPR